MSPRDPWSDHLGICSVTLRHLSAEAVIEVTRDAGLGRIEWGADVHAPPSDLARVAQVGELTVSAGLTVASYGSYWRAGVSPMSDLQAVAAAAVTLGAPRVRVWAGELGTDAADTSTWDAVVGALHEACAVARDRGLQLALEFHPNTLTDSADSTLDLLDRVGDETLGTYWQPRLDEATEASVTDLRRLTPRLAGIHVFSWWPGANRLMLNERADLWSAVADVVVAEASPCDLLLEFVPGDDPSLVACEADALRRFIAVSGG